MEMSAKSASAIAKTVGELWPSAPKAHYAVLIEAVRDCREERWSYTSYAGKSKL